MANVTTFLPIGFAFFLQKFIFLHYTLNFTLQLSYGQTEQGTTAQMHGGYSVEGHEAGDDCAQVSVQPRV